MQTRRAWLAALMVAAMAAGPGRAAEEKAGLAALKGEWKGEHNGEESVWSFDPEAKTVTTTVNGMDYVSDLAVDDKASPKTIDFTIKSGIPDLIGKKLPGIYKFEGERLLISVAPPGSDDRPTEFKEEDGTSWLFELNRK